MGLVPSEVLNGSANGSAMIDFHGCKQSLYSEQETLVRIAYLGLGVSSNMSLSLAPDAEVQKCMCRLVARCTGNRSCRLYDEFPLVAFPIGLSIENLPGGAVHLGRGLHR